MNILVRSAMLGPRCRLLTRATRLAWSGGVPAGTPCVSAFSTNYPGTHPQSGVAGAMVENTSAAAAVQLEIPANLMIDTLERHGVRRINLNLSDRLIPIEVLPTWSERVLVQLYVDDDSNRTTNNQPHLTAVDSVSRDRAARIGLAVGIDFLPEDVDTRSESLKVRMYVPQVCDITVQSGQNITVFDKVEGDVELHTSHGDITVNKIRGTAMSLSAPNGQIKASSLIEGRTVTLHAGKSIQIKRLMASSNVVVTSDSGDVSMNSCYTTAVTVTATNGHVSVSSLHGSLNAVAKNSIKVVGIDGIVTANSGMGDVTVVYDRVSKSQRSALVANSGNVYVTVPSDLKCETDLELNAKKVTIPSGKGDVVNSSNRWADTGTSNIDSDIDNSKDENVKVLDDGSQMFKGELGAHLSSSRGVLNPLQRTGKINYNASRTSQWDASPTADHASSSASSYSSPTPPSPPLSEKWKLSASAPNGNVTVKMLSWIESVIGTVPGREGRDK